MERVILDIDGGGGDKLAILFAAASPDLKLEGVTTVSGAAGGVTQATETALNALAWAGRQDIPVAAGAWRPIVGNAKADMEAAVQFEKRLVACVGDRLKTFGAAALAGDKPPLAGHAVDFILDRARAAPGEITLVSTGPLTNVAMAFLQAPDFGGLLKRLVIFGGAISAPGNMTPIAEYNIWADPEAARIVLNADVDKILAPLDARQGGRGAADPPTRDAIVDLAATAADNPVIAMIEAVFPIHGDLCGEVLDVEVSPLDGVMAAALAFAPDLCAMTGPYFVDVALEGRLCRGQTVAYRGRQILPGGGPKTTRICADVDGPRLFALFEQTMRRYERRAASAGSV